VLCIPRSVLEKIVALCKANRTEEVCGVLVGIWTGTKKQVSRIVPTENVARSHRDTRYRIDDRHILDLENSLRGSSEEIIGFYHSHLNSPQLPSQYDKSLAWEEYSYIIVAVGNSGPEPYAAWVMKSRNAGFEKEILRVIESQSEDEIPDSRREG
jgi:proteasome lid subunit RPN8/RPN11